MTPDVDQPGAASARTGRRLGLDVGTVRVGVAVSDSAARMATPVETVPRETSLEELRAGETTGADLRRVAELCREYQVVEVIVGLPRNLSGRGSRSVDQARVFGAAVGSLVAEAPVRFCDERLTTVLAAQALRASGVSSKNSRGVIDQAAAVEILQSWLDARKAYLERDGSDAASEIAPRPAPPSPADLARKPRPTRRPQR